MMNAIRKKELDAHSYIQPITGPYLDRKWNAKLAGFVAFGLTDCFECNEGNTIRSQEYILLIQSRQKKNAKNSN